MCSGRTHAAIGLVGAEIFAMFLNSSSSVNFNVTDFATIGVGAVVGSLIVDIDSKKSKASQVFNKGLIGFIVILLISRFVEVNSESLHLIDFIGRFIKSYLFAILFIALTTVSHLTSHRVFTHKIVGTVAFALLAVLAFDREFAMAFVIGYVLHLIADELFTKEDLRFFELRLPLQNSKGEFHVSL